MTEPLVSYRMEGSVATLVMDDGKRNALSLRMFEELDAALDRAEAEKAAVVLTGRPDVFSAGFDLKVLRKGGAARPPRAISRPSGEGVLVMPAVETELAGFETTDAVQASHGKCRPCPW